MKKIRSQTALLMVLAAIIPLLIACQAQTRPDGQQLKSEEVVVVEKIEVPGIRNFTRVGNTVGFGGATQASAMAWLEDDGFVSVINLRLATEKDVELEAGRAAAEAAGLSYIHLPFNTSKPDPQLVENFLAAVDDETKQPVYVHCGSATRAAALWMIKRVLEDDWEIDEAAEEARAIAGKPDAAVAWATNYLQE